MKTKDFTQQELATCWKHINESYEDLKEAFPFYTKREFLDNLWNASTKDVRDNDSTEVEKGYSLLYIGTLIAYAGYQQGVNCRAGKIDSVVLTNLVTGFSIIGIAAVTIAAFLI